MEAGGHLCPKSQVQQEGSGPRKDVGRATCAQTWLMSTSSRKPWNPPSPQAAWGLHIKLPKTLPRREGGVGNRQGDASHRSQGEGHGQPVSWELP